MEGFVKSHRPHHRNLLGRRVIARNLSLLSLLLLSAFASSPAQALHSGQLRRQLARPAADAPSGFLPGVITYFAGDGGDAVTPTNGSLATQVSLTSASSVASDSHGNIYVVASSNLLYIVYAGGVVPAPLANVTTKVGAPAPVAGAIYQVGNVNQYFCGGSPGGDTDPDPDTTCGEGKTLDVASFNDISGLAFDSSDNLYILDYYTNVIRKVPTSASSSPVVTTIVGQLNNPGYSGDGGAATSATLASPIDLKLDSSGNLYFTDQGYTVARVVYSGSQAPPILAAEGITGAAAASGTINTIAGQATVYCFATPTQGSSGNPGGCGDYGPATAATASFVNLTSLDVDAAGNIYLADDYVNGGANSTGAEYLRIVYAGAPAPTLLSLSLNGAAPTPGYIYAATGYDPSVDFAPCASAPCGDGGLGADVAFGNSSEMFLKLDTLGNLYIADYGSAAVRKIDTSGYSSTIAGVILTPCSGTCPSPSGGSATSTDLISPQWLAFDPTGNLYVVDTNLVWQVAPLPSQTIDFPALDPATVTYGQAPITLEATASSGLPVSFAVTSGPGTISGGKLAINGFGTIVVTASQAGSSNYAPATPVSRSLTVDPAPLTVTVNNATRNYGAANPTFTATYTGFVGTDTAATAGAVSGAPAFTTSATSTSQPGTYAIDVAVGSLTSTKYSFTDFVPGTLTVNATSTINFAAPAAATYGQGNVTLSATATSGNPVTFAVTSGPGTIAGSTLTITGAGTIDITATSPGANPVSQSLTVNKASLTVTGPTVTVPYTTDITTAFLGTLPAPTITGFVGTDSQAADISGTASYTAVTGVLNPGIYGIVVNLGTLAINPAVTANYAFAAKTVNGSLRIMAGSGPPFPSPGDIYYYAGDGPGLAGTYANGVLPTTVPLPGPTAVAADSGGNIYFSTGGTIYIVYSGLKTPASLSNVVAAPVSGDIYQVAGLVGLCGQIADPTCGEGLALNLASFGGIAGMAFDSADNLYISDSVSSVIRKVDATTSVVTTIAGTLNAPSASAAIGDGGPATNATLNLPGDLKVDSSGNVYVSDQAGKVARVIYTASATAAPAILAAEGINGAAAQPGTINTIAGQAASLCAAAPTAGSAAAPGACGDFGPAASASFLRLNSLAVDTAGNVYFADARSGATPAGAYLRVAYAGVSIPTLLSNTLSGAAPTPGSIYAATGYGATTPFALCAATPCGDGGGAAAMQFGASAKNLSLALDAAGDVVIADSGDFAVRKLDTSGNVSTIAGIDDPNQTPVANPPSAQGGLGTSTALSNSLNAVAFDPQGNLFLADAGDDLLWQLAPLQEQQISFPVFSAGVTYGANLSSNPLPLSASSTSGLPVTFAVTSGPGTIVTTPNGSGLVVNGGGTIVVTASQVGNSQYRAALPVQETLNVLPAALTVTAPTFTVPYGTTASTITPSAYPPTFAGFVGTDSPTTPGIFSGQVQYTTTYTTNAPQASYPIVVSAGTFTSANYTLTGFTAGQLTVVGTTTPTINFAPLAPVTYGQPTTLALTATSSSGLPVTYQVVSGPGTITGSTLTITGGGTIVITASSAGAEQYLAANPVTQSLVVNPATLTVTGPTVTTSYGASFTPSTFPAPTITGFVGGDTQASVLTGATLYSTISATPAPNAGTYPITVALGTLAVLPAESANYVLGTPASGSLIIQPAAQTISFNTVPSGQIYGNLTQLAAAATSGLPVVFTATGPAVFYNGVNTTSPPNSNFVQVDFTGVGTATVTATQTGNGNYQAAPPVTQTVPVGQAPLDIIAAPPQVLEEGAAIPATFPYVIGNPSGGTGSFVNGDKDIPSVITGLPLLTTTATQGSAPGVYPIVPTVGTLAAPNYYFVFVNSTLTITPPGSFNITASPSSLTIPAGLTGQSTLTITPTNAYQGTVTLSCGQLPANVTCVISPSTYTFPGQNPDGSAEFPAQGTITITAAAATASAKDQGPSISTAKLLLIPAALAGLLLAFARRRAAKRSAIWRVVVLLALGCGMMSTTSCGSGSSKSATTTSLGTSTVTVLGTGTTVTGNGTVTSSALLSVTIQ
jgi:hypothetical protein